MQLQLFFIFFNKSYIALCVKGFKGLLTIIVNSGLLKTRALMLISFIKNPSIFKQICKANF